MNTFRTIVAFFQAILPLLGFGFIAVILYSEFESPYNVVLAVVVIIIGMFMSRSLFMFMQRRGVISTMAGNNATTDLDELEPTPGSAVLKLSPLELAAVFLENKIVFNQGTTVSIWGDWNGRRLDERHQLKSIDFNADINVLLIEFTDNCRLKITRPGLIFYTISYLKVVKADKIVWQTPVDSNALDQYSYSNTGVEIQTESNTEWKPHAYDIGIGMNALYLQG